MQLRTSHPSYLCRLSLACLVFLNSWVNGQQPFFIPTYTTSPGGTNNVAGWAFNDYHFQQQCQRIVTTPGYDYYCSIDSGWSLNGGDEYGRIVPDNKGIFTTTGSLANFASWAHSKGLKVDIYLLPGAIQADANRIIENTTITIGNVLDPNCQVYNLRQAFIWEADGVQQWHDSVVSNLAAMGVDMIKRDYLTPGSPGSGETLPADTSQSVVKYHNALEKYGNGMRLDTSWALNRSEPHSSSFSGWKSVQRTIEAYRAFIVQQIHAVGNIPITIRPDMDNTYVGNPSALSGLLDVQRYSMTIHWIGAGANLITGSDLVYLPDSLGTELLYNEEAMSIAAFTATYPMQPRNPSGWGTVGAYESAQLQAWIAGPSPDGTKAVVVLANYGPDQGEGGFGLNWGGVHLVTIPLSDLGIGGSTWCVRRVWGGGGSGGQDHTDIGNWTATAYSDLGENESVMYSFTKWTGGAACPGSK